MKLVSFRFEGRDRIGFSVGEDKLADLAEAAAAMGRTNAPGDMIALIEAGDAGLGFLRDARDFVA